MALDPGQYVTRLTKLLATRGLPQDLMPRALAHAKQHRLGLGAALRATGVDEALLLQLSAEASGLSVAQELPSLEAGLANGFDAVRCRAMPMVPVRREGGVVVVACTDPLVALTADARELPPHRLVLASEQVVRQALAHLFGDAEAGAERTAVSGKNKVPAASTRQYEAASNPSGADLPKVLGDFERLELLGQGGMASVFRGRELTTGRLVALKVMLPAIAADKDYIARFLQEARATRHLTHPNVVGVLGYGREGHHPWMASEFVDRGTLEELLSVTGPMPAPLALEVFAQALAGVGAAHAEGIIHRDLKPANLLITSEGVVKVGDFGIAKVEGAAKLTQTGIVIGTPAYMSPEQAGARRLTPATDLFSMGIILYELLSGTNPHNAESAAAAMVRVLAGSVPPITFSVPTLDPALEPFLEKLLAPEPADRPSSIPALLEELSAWLGPWRKGGQNLVALAISEPRNARATIAAMEARCLFEQAKPLLLGDANERRQAAMLLYRASVADGANAELAKTFQELCASEKLRVGRTENPKIKELEEALVAQPDSPGVLQQLANLYRLEGNVFHAADYMRRYVKLRPNDGYAVGQLAVLTGAPPALRPAAAAQALPKAGRLRSPGAKQPASDSFVEYSGGGGGGGSVFFDLLRAHGRLVGMLGSMATIALMAWVMTSRIGVRAPRESARGASDRWQERSSAGPALPADDLGEARVAARSGRAALALELLNGFFLSAPSEHPLRGEALTLRAEANLHLDHLPNAEMDATDALAALPPREDELRRRAQAVLASLAARRPTPEYQAPFDPPPPPPPRRDDQNTGRGGSSPPMNLNIPSFSGMP